MVIRTATQEKIRAYVKWITDSKMGQFGPYQSVLFIREDKPAGKEAEVWRAVNPSEAALFEIGQVVYLIPTVNKKGQDSWDVEIVGICDEAPTVPAAAATAPTVPEKSKDVCGIAKTEIAQYVQDMAALYLHCLTTAKATLPQGTSPQQIQGMTTTIFISCREHFKI